MKLDALVRWYSTLTPETIPGVCDLYHEQARFRDPFNDVRGHRAIARVFRHMFETAGNPVFRITATQREGDTAWVSWTFQFRMRGRDRSVEGATRLDFGADGRVLEHRDFWDPTELFVAAPLFGTLLRSLKARLRAPQRGSCDL